MRTIVHAGYETLIPLESLRAIDSSELGQLAVILETESDENGRIFGDVKLIHGPYGGITVEVPAPTAKEANDKTVILGNILKKFRS